MITQAHIDSGKSYAMGLGAMTLPAALANITGWLQFLTAAVGFVVIVHRALHDYNEAKRKKNERTLGPGSTSKDIPPQNP
jgi:hypothetical protein